MGSFAGSGASVTLISAVLSSNIFSSCSDVAKMHGFSVLLLNDQL